MGWTLVLACILTSFVTAYVTAEIISANAFKHTSAYVEEIIEMTKECFKDIIHHLANRFQ